MNLRIVKCHDGEDCEKLEKMNEYIETTINGRYMTNPCISCPKKNVIIREEQE